MESLSRPFFHRRRKLSSASSSNGLSFSSKDAYDDILTGVSKVKFAAASSFASRGVAVEDYDEIFGCGNGKRGSSIPVLDLSDLHKPNGSGDCKLDYSKIFGGFAADDDIAMAVPPYEELFAGAKKAKSDKAKARTPADKGSPLKGSGRFNSSEKNRGLLTEASHELFGGGKQLNMSYHRTSQQSKDGPNGTTHVAQHHTVPRFTYFIDESAHPLEIPHDKPIPSVKTEVNRNRSLSGEIFEGKSGRRAKWQLPNTQSSEGLVTGSDDHSQDQPHPNDKFFNSGEPNFKLHASKVPPSSSSSANLNDSIGHAKQLKSSTFCPKIEASEKDASGYLTPSSDEELDVNSAAAVSAAALKKAIQQAQESIRIAKELMERKKDPIQSSKSHPKPSSKVKDRRETKYDQHISRVRENNIEDACECTATEVQTFTTCGQKVAMEGDQVASAFKLRGNLSIDGKADEKHEESAEVAGEQGLAMWFTQLLNNGKNRMAAFASQLVDNKNSTFQPVSGHTYDVEGTKPTKEAFEGGTIEKMDSVPKVLELSDNEAKLNALVGAPELGKNAVKSNSVTSVHEDKVSTTLVTAPEDEATKKIHHDFDEEGKCEKKLDYCQVTMKDRLIESEKLANACLANDFMDLVGKKMEGQISFIMETEKKIDDVCAREAKKTRLVEDEIGRKQEGGSCLRKENVGKRKAAISNESNGEKQEDFQAVVTPENRLGACDQQDSDELRSYEDKPKAAIGNESNGEKQEDFQEEVTPENRLGTCDQQRSDELRSTNSLDEVQSENMSDKEYQWEGIDEISTGTYQNKVRYGMDTDAGNYIQNQKIEVFQGGKETDNAHGKTNEHEENLSADLFPESANEENINVTLDAGIDDKVTSLNETLDAYRSIAENISERVSELETGNFGKNGNLTVMTEQTNQPEGRKNEDIGHFEFKEDENRAEQAVEEGVRSMGSKISESSRKDETFGEENILECTIQDVSDGLASDAHIENFVFIPTTNEEEVPTCLVTFKTTGSIHSDTKDHAIDNNDATVATPVEISSYFGFSGINWHKQIEQNDDKSEFAVGPENNDGFTRESERHAENVLEEDGYAFEKEVGNNCIGMDGVESQKVEKLMESDYSQLPSEPKGSEEHLGTTGTNAGQNGGNCEENRCTGLAKEDKETKENGQKELGGKDYPKRIELSTREREREKDKIAVERAICEARERAFAEACERAERAAVEKATAEVRQRAMAEAWEKLEKVSSATEVPTDKTSVEAKLRAERAAVKRATAEARERALEKALSLKTTKETRMLAGKTAGKSSGAYRDAGIKHSFSSSDLERFDEAHNESDQRRKARSERNQRIMERAAKALAEKNMRDILALREQAERNRLAETLDADIKRWASGKEGNLRSLLSTLQYILGKDSGWQPIALTEIITTGAVKKAYRKATLYVHPDKLQQRGASIQQKYICEKVFDLLKAASNKFNSEER